MAAFLLAGCGGSSNDNTPQVVDTPTPEPTLTFEERIQFEAGRRENPLRMVIRPVDTIRDMVLDLAGEALGQRRVTPETSIDLQDDEIRTALDAALQETFGVSLMVEGDEAIGTVGDLVGYVQNAVGQQVTDDIFERTSLYVNVILVDSYAQALTELCNSGTGLVAIPWLGGVTYMAAIAQNCGKPGLQVAKSEPLMQAAEATPEAESTAEADSADVTTQSDLHTGTAGLIVSLPEFEPESLADAAGTSLCRIGLSDFYSWFLSALMMTEQGLDPLRDIIIKDDFDSFASLLEAVQDGECDLAGVPEDALTSSQINEFRVVQSSVAFPYGVLMYPLEVGVGVRLSLNDNLPVLAADSEQGYHLRLLLGQTALLPAAPDDFTDMVDYLNATGYDFAELGD